MSVNKNIEGVSVALPLVYDSTDGPYRLNKSVGETVRQNFKNLILTSPGERIMLPDFGVGLKSFLFEPMHPQLFANIRNRIDTQVDLYMPFLTINDVSYFDADMDPTLGLNELKIVISYSMDPLNEDATLEITDTID